MRGSDVNTWTLDNFGAGEDLREGVFAQDQNRFKEMLNVRTTSARRIVRRPPVVLSSGSFGSGCRGLVLVGSTLKTIRKKGTSDAAPTGVGILEFDNPDHCTSWTLIQATVFNGHVVALIKHDYPGGAVISRIFLHVWDGKANKPTYVEDPFCPTNWGPTLPLHVYRTGMAGAFTDYTPKMHVAKGRLYISRPDGNVAFCKVANARSWNTRTVDEFVDHGEWYYFITNTTSGVQDFIVSEDYGTLFTDQRWSAFILEYLDSTGTWQKFSEDLADPTVDKHYQPQSVAGRFSGVANEIRLRIYWTGAAGTIIRFRLIAGEPPNKPGPGSDFPLDWNQNEAFNGTGAQTVFQTTTIDTLSPAIVYLSGVLQVVGVDYNTALIGGFLRVTFVVAPPAGTGNVRVFHPTNTWAYAGASSFEGISGEGASGILSMPQSIGTEFIYGAGLRVQLGGGGMVSGDMQGVLRYHGRFTRRVTVTGVNPPIDVQEVEYFYGFEAGHESAFYSERLLDYQLNQAGADDAGYLPTAATAVSGGVVTLLCGIKDRLFVAYKDGAELWEVATDPALASRIDTSPLGTGQQTSPVGVLFEGILMVPLASGLWGVSLGNDLSDRMNSNRLGDPIQRAGIPIIKEATYWPWLGCYVAAQATNDEFSFRVFDYNRETKVAAWSRWQTAAIGTDEGVDPGHMVAVADRLYFRKGSELLYFDASVYDSGSPVFRDESDAVGNAYVSRLVWHRNDFKRPGAAKRFLYLDMAQQGTCRTAFRTVAYDDNQELDGPTIAGTTYGKERVPLSMTVQAIAPILESTDETGWELERLALDFRHMRR